MSLPQVILLNGTSSSGKTSIAKELQELLLPTLYLNFSIDSILYALPPSVLKGMITGKLPPHFDYWALVESYYRSAGALVAHGNHLILDDAVTEAPIADLIQKTFAGSRVFAVGVKCDLEELKRRERERGDRNLGEAEAQFGAVHRFLKYDLEVDSSKASPLSLATKIQQALPI